MKREELEKYIGELSPELQAKARQCKDMGELNALLAENDVELSEDALQAVSGGCSASSPSYSQGEPVSSCKCPECNGQLYYWDMCSFEMGCRYIVRMYCANTSCSSYNNGLWYASSNAWATDINYSNISKY